MELPSAEGPAEASGPGTQTERERAAGRRQARYVEQVAALARLQAAGVSMDALRRGKWLIDSGRFSDWPDGPPPGA